VVAVDPRLDHSTQLSGDRAELSVGDEAEAICRLARDSDGERDEVRFGLRPLLHAHFMNYSLKQP
jgi:hypothetical protein